MYSSKYDFNDPTLPYDIDALEPHISKEVVDVHFNKHTLGYYKKTREVIKGTIFAKKEYLDDILNTDITITDTVIQNNVAQAWNHRFYWEGLTPEKTSPSGALLKQIEEQYETLDKLRDRFIDKATSFFGSGWVWLVATDNGIQIKTTPNATLLPEQMRPILVIDVWEHAYYLQYPADKASYCKNVWNLINWKVAEENFKNGAK